MVFEKPMLPKSVDLSIHLDLPLLWQNFLSYGEYFRASNHLSQSDYEKKTESLQEFT